MKWSPTPQCTWVFQVLIPSYLSNVQDLVPHYQVDRFQALVPHYQVDRFQALVPHHQVDRFQDQVPHHQVDRFQDQVDRFQALVRHNQVGRFQALEVWIHYLQGNPAHHSHQAWLVGHHFLPGMCLLAFAEVGSLP
ncbi:unnamed protein product [Pleuronectes platessa]|uniref:Uncharacterized protein n=1 Tax=Pleuronectes platessa TaxID=8262 RepID=A0A9N7UN12_PLEPL|nr:unnamed protein product [Pleuronectes platessa]